jgi:hypothetical protein
MPPSEDADRRVTKRRVTMRSSFADQATGDAITVTSTDYVDAARPGLLEAYVSDARRRWQYVGVSDEPDAGYDGATSIPFGTPNPVRDSAGNVTDVEFHEFPHELAGTFFPSTDGSDADGAPSHPLTGARARTITPQEG